MSNSQNNVALLAVGALTSIVVGAIGWRVISRNDNKDVDEGIPAVPSLVPYVGSTRDYFASIVCFMEKYFTMYDGKPFKATILGHTWYFLNDPADIRKVFRSPEKSMSFYSAIDVVAGKMFPTEEIEGKDSPDQVKSIFRSSGLSSTGFFIHALKHLPGWIPQLREAFQYNFSTYLQDEGEKDIFDWCLDLIGLATSRVMMGAHADIDTVKEWMQIVKDCDIDIALSGQGFVGTLTSFAEIALTGERPIYRKARKFTYPYIETEIENYLADKPENGSVVCSLVYVVGKRLNAKENPDLLREAKVRIANDLILFTFAAITNSYGAAAWSLYHVLKDTEGCSEKIRSEMAKTKNDLSSIVSETLEMTILEITRLYTPGNGFRYVKTPFQLESDPKKVIPVGSLIGINGALIGRRPEVYLNPCKFDPSRFDPSSSQYETSYDNFLGFGSGAHPCVGKRFALSEISLFVAEALNTFDFELLEETPYEETNKDENALELTKRMIHNVPNHPILDPSQTNSIWRPIHPIMIKYKRKKMV